jgi:NACalpha-BTF3-like transcription factor
MSLLLGTCGVIAKKRGRCQYAEKPSCSIQNMKGAVMVHVRSRKPAKPAAVSENTVVPDFSELAKAYVAQATASKKSAIEALRRIGTHNSKGKLTKHYR